MSGRLYVVAGPDYWAIRARLNREKWWAEAARYRSIISALRRHTRVRGSSKQVAHDLDVARPTVSAVLRGRLDPTPEMVRRYGTRPSLPQKEAV